ncbi:MAG: ABC transporter permease subunit [Thomasclavelia sp.]|nr:ABC transporter permease subunit [Thomasclavelia sp.]
MNKLNIFKLELKANSRSFLLWSVACSILLVIYILLFPMMEQMDINSMMSQMTNTMPEALTKMFGMDGIKDYSSLSNYLTVVLSEFNIFILIYGAYLGGTTLVKEESEGTIEYLYSMPVTRTKIFFEKLLAIVFLYFGFMVINVIVGIVSSFFVTNVDFNLVKDFLKLFSSAFIVGLVYLSLGYFSSTLLRSTKQAIALSIGMVLVTFIIGSFSGISESLDWIKYLAPINYCNGSDILTSGFSLTYGLLSVGIIVVSIGLSYYIYRKKDFKV